MLTDVMSLNGYESQTCTPAANTQYRTGPT